MKYLVATYRVKLHVQKQQLCMASEISSKRNVIVAGIGISSGMAGVA